MKKIHPAWLLAVGAGVWWFMRRREEATPNVALIPPTTGGGPNMMPERDAKADQEHLGGVTLAPNPQGGGRIFANNPQAQAPGAGPANGG